MMLVNNDPNKYERVYIPKFLHVEYDEVEHYEYIKTVQAGSSVGHILMGGGDYFLCLSKNTKVRLEERTMEPMGFRMKTVEEADSMAEMFTKAFNADMRAYKGYNGASRKWDNVVEVPTIDWSLPWHVRMRTYNIINIETGKEVSLGLSKPEISKQTGLTYHLINVIVKHGVEAGVHEMWALKGKRLDGLTWEQYFKGEVPTVPYIQPDGQSNAKEHYKTRNALKNITFEKDGDSFTYTTLRETSKIINTSHETLRKLLLARAEQIKGFKVSYS
jgi:hypothetical protein